MASMCRDSRRPTGQPPASQDPVHAGRTALADPEKRGCSFASDSLTPVYAQARGPWDAEKGRTPAPIVEDVFAACRTDRLKKLWIAFCLTVFLLGFIWQPASGYIAGQSPRSALQDSTSALLARCSALPPVPDESFHARREALAAVLAAEGAHDVYIAEPGASAEYYAGIGSGDWHLSERTFLLVILPELADSDGAAGGHRIIVLTPEFEADRAKLLRIPGAGRDAKGSIVVDQVTYVSWPEAGSPFAVLAGHLASLPGANSVQRVHIDPYVRTFIAAGLEDAFRAQEGLWRAHVQVANEAVRSIRERKDRDEVELLRCANELTLQAIRLTRSEMHIGIKESQTRAILEKHMSKLGLEDASGLVLFGENAALPHGSGTDRALGKHDFALIDTGGKFRGYVADVTRTFALDKSKIPAEHLRIWDTVHAAQKQAHTAIRKGVTGQEVDAAARRVVAERAKGSKEAQGFTHRLGHGIGLEGHESPYLVGSNAAPLLPGNTFSNEPGVYILNEVGVRLEDCFVVQEDGSASLFTGQAASPWKI